MRGNKITKEDMATLCPYLTAHLKRFGDIIMDFNGVPKMLIGAEARCYGEQKRIVVIQIIRHRKRQKNLFVISFETGVQFRNVSWHGAIIRRRARWVRAVNFQRHILTCYVLRLGQTGRALLK